jgi:hypothetical protein
MMMRAVVLLLCLAWGQAWGATGSAAADTFYVRPTADCAENGDGMAYACAASAGASGAWRGLASVSHSTTTGVDDGDTLKYCGNFVAADADTGTQMIFHAATVTAASEGARITETGDCSADGGSADATFTGGGAIVTGLAYSVSDYITFEHMRFTGFTNAIANTCSPASDPDAPKFNDITIDNTSGAGMVFTGVNYVLTDINIESQGEPLFVCNGVGSAATGAAARLTLTQLDVSDANADGFQVEAGGAGTSWTDITVNKWGAFKGCAILGSVSGISSIDGLDCTCLGTTAAVTGVAVDGSGAGGFLRNIKIKDCGGSAILLRADVTPFAGAFTVSGFICENTRECLALSGAHASGALSIYNGSGTFTEEAIFADSTYNPASTTFRNLALDGPIGISIDSAVAAADIDIDYTRYGPSVTSWIWRGTTDTTLAAYKTTSSKDAASTQNDMDWVGGTSPTDAAGFCPGPDSALLGAGSYIGAYVLGYGGESLPNPPPIGARGLCNARRETPTRRAATR